jgi:hypothetical protein
VLVHRIHYDASHALTLHANISKRHQDEPAQETNPPYRLTTSWLWVAPTPPAAAGRQNSRPGTAGSEVTRPGTSHSQLTQPGTGYNSQLTQPGTGELAKPGNRDYGGGVAPLQPRNCNR